MNDVDYFQPGRIYQFVSNNDQSGRLVDLNFYLLPGRKGFNQYSYHAEIFSLFTTHRLQYWEIYVFIDYIQAPKDISNDHEPVEPLIYGNCSCYNCITHPTNRSCLILADGKLYLTKSSTLMCSLIVPAEQIL